MIIWLLATWISIGQLPLFYEGIAQLKTNEPTSSKSSRGNDIESSNIYLYEYCNGCSLKKMSRKELIALKLTKLIADS